MDLTAYGERFEKVEALDAPAVALEDVAQRVAPRGSPRRDVLSGAWLGHPLHPALTDVTVGAWTSALVLDLLPGRRWRPAADALVAIGVLSALPTAVTGLTDWSSLGTSGRRTGVVHAAANLVATGLYVRSLGARLRGRRIRGVAWGLAGATAATAGGFLGGHLAYRLADS